MTKQDQVVFVVQTAVLTNSINLASQPEADRHRHLYSASGVLGLMNDALYASERIPELKSAFEAALEFCAYMFENLRKPKEEDSGKRMDAPYWFKRG